MKRISKIYRKRLSLRIGRLHGEEMIDRLHDISVQSADPW